VCKAVHNKNLLPRRQLRLIVVGAPRRLPRPERAARGGCVAPVGEHDGVRHWRVIRWPSETSSAWVEAAKSLKAEVEEVEMAIINNIKRAPFFSSAHVLTWAGCSALWVVVMSNYKSTHRGRWTAACIWNNWRLQERTEESHVESAILCCVKSLADYLWLFASFAPQRGRGLSLWPISMETVIISFIHHEELTTSSASYLLRTSHTRLSSSTLIVFHNSASGEFFNKYFNLRQIFRAAQFTSFESFTSFASFVPPVENSHQLLRLSCTLTLLMGSALINDSQLCFC